MKSLTGVRRLVRQADRRSLARADSAEVERQVQFVQTYGGGYPAEEFPLQNYEQFARHVFGSWGTTGNAVVFAAIARRLSVFTEAAFKFRDLRTKRLFGGPALAKLEQPWPGGSTQSLWAWMELDASLAGNSFIRDTGNGLERLRPDWVTIISRVELDQLGHQVRRVVGYWYCPVGDTERGDELFLTDEVAHWAPIPDPLMNFRGLSWISEVIREINGDIRMAEYREAFFRNAATPNIVIKYQDKIAPERVERLQTRLRERNTGMDGAFSTLILDQGADMTVVGQNMVGSAFDDLQAAGETRILMAAGVPPVVAGARQGLQASEVGEYAVGLRALADMTIRPNWRGACAALEKLVQVPPGAQLWIDTTDVSALQQGEQDKAATSQQQAATIAQLIMQGFDPDSVVAAVVAGDMTLLEHTGAMSVQVQPMSANQMGQPPAAQQPEPADPGGTDD
jgi:Phage portal protein